MNIVCFTQTAWNEAPEYQRQLLGRLARRGHRVLIIEPAAGAPLNAFAALRQTNRCSISQVYDGLHVMTPRPLTGLPAVLATHVHRRTLAVAAEALGQWAPVVICTDLGQAQLAGAVKPTARVYLARDGAQPPPPAETRALHGFEVLVASTQPSLGSYEGLHPNVALLEVGIEPAQLAQAPLPDPSSGLRSLPRPRIGCLEGMDGRTDAELVSRLAHRFVRGAVVLSGGYGDHEAANSLSAHSNVHIVDPQHARDLPAVCRELDVVVVPWLPSANSGRPTGLLCALAADLPVIATSLPDSHPAAQAVVIAPTHDDFIAAVAREIEDPERLAAQRRAVIESSSWQRRADQLEELLRRAVQLGNEKRQRQGLASPRPDRHGRQAAKVEPRLDGKDASVRLLHDNYVQNGLSAQQHLLYLASRVAGVLYWAARVPIRLLQGKGLVRRILVVRNGHLGDTVVFLPTLVALRRRYPGATITVALAPDSGARLLLDASPLVDAVMPLDFFNRSRRDRFLGALRLLAHGFDMIVGGVWYFHLPEAVYSGAPIRLGLYDGHPLQRYADRVVMLDPTMHEAENNLRLVELVTGTMPLEARVPRLSLNEPALMQQAAQLRQTLDLPAESPVVAMHPGSKRPSRRWPPEGFAELAENLLRERRDLYVVFTGAGHDEQELIARIRALIPAELRQRTRDGSRGTDLLGIIGFYDTCRLLVCNDTGVMHLARARGVPLVAIIGPENDRRWGPHPLGLGPAVTVRNQVPGTPHGKWECEWNLSLASVDAARIKRHCDAILDCKLASLHRFQPVQAGSETFFPLVRDFRHLSFAQLQELGMELPRVAIVLVQDPALLGGSGPSASTQELAAAARATRQQTYPAIQTLLVVSDAAPFGELDIGTARLVCVDDYDPDAAWAAVLGATAARLFWPVSAFSRLEPVAVANRVSVFLRGPNAQVVDDERAWHARTLIDSDFVGGPWIIQRSALEMRLSHPLPQPRPAADEPTESGTLEGALVAT